MHGPLHCQIYHVSHNLISYHLFHQVMLPNGARIEVADTHNNSFGSSLNIKITASYDDYEWNEVHTEGVGLCGKVIHPVDEDLIMRDGTTAGSVPDFIADWR